MNGSSSLENLSTYSYPKDIQLKVITEPINTEIVAPPSKSYTHRALIASALAEGDSTIINPLIAEDTILTLTALRDLGVKIERRSNSYVVSGTGGKLTAPRKEIYLNNSGTSMRLLLSIASLADRRVILSGNNHLCQRPILDLVDALRNLGVRNQYLRKVGYPPIAVESKLIGGSTTIRSDKSSQYISSLLLCAPYAINDVEICPTTRIMSKPYVSLTVDVMQDFGINPIVKNNCYRIIAEQRYQACNYKIEGDYSSASYFFAITAALGGQISVLGLNPYSQQADRILLAVLEKMGCQINATNGSTILYRDPSVDLDGVDIDLSNSPDIVQTIAVLACFANSPSTLRNIHHLKFKECNRLKATADELRKLGANITQTDHSLIIYPPKKFQPATIETYNDHRMVMAFTIAALKIPRIRLLNPSCVQKSFPNFFEKLQRFYRCRSSGLK